MIYIYIYIYSLFILEEYTVQTPLKRKATADDNVGAAKRPRAEEFKPKKKQLHAMGSGHFQSPHKSKCVIHCHTRRPSRKDCNHLVKLSIHNINMLHKLRSDLKLLIQEYQGHSSNCDRDYYNILRNLPDNKEDWVGKLACGGKG